LSNWYWIELIGFDREAPDYGVGHFFDVTSSKIEGISLLFADVDFVNLHDGVTGKTLRPCDCTYYGLPCSEERDRQPWKDTELKGLVAELHKRGVKVTFAFFDMFYYVDDNGELAVGEFCENHPELWSLKANGDKFYGLHMLKRFNDGTYYEDYLFSQVNRVIEDYGFDGVQLADGISSARQSVQSGDFSDDIVEQFLKHSPQVSLQETEYTKRREEIIQSYYYEYLTFLSDRWAAYYEKAYQTVKGIVILNQAWTCNPFEALYRYGIDYGKIQSDKAYGIMLEDVSPNMPIYSKRDNGGYDSTEEDRVGYHYKFMLMQMMMKSYLPNTNLMALTPVKDTTEQWDVLRHSPMELSANIIRRKNTFYYENGYQRCVNNPFFCLSNGLAKSDWQWIHKQLEDAEFEALQSVCGYTVLFSEQGLYGEIKQYIQNRSYSSCEFFYRLLLNGLDIGCGASVSQADKIKTPALVFNYHLLSADEKQTIENSLAPMVIFSETPVELDGFSVQAHYHIAFRNIEPTSEMLEEIKQLQNMSHITQATNKEDDMKGYWTCPLQYSHFSNEYFVSLVKILTKGAGLKPVGEGVHVTRHQIGENQYRYFLRNDTYRYHLPVIECSGNVEEAVSVLKYKGYRVAKKEATFTDRIPPRGMTVVETKEEG